MLGFWDESYTLEGKHCQPCSCLQSRLVKPKLTLWCQARKKSTEDPAGHCLLLGFFAWKKNSDVLRKERQGVSETHQIRCSCRWHCQETPKMQPVSTLATTALKTLVTDPEGGQVQGQATPREQQWPIFLSPSMPLLHLFHGCKKQCINAGAIFHWAQPNSKVSWIWS